MGRAVLKRWLLPGLMALFLLVGLHLVKGWELGGRQLKDSLAAVGLGFVLFGGLRFVLRTGLFASTQFGYKKLLEIIRTKVYTKGQSKLGDMGSFVASYKYSKPYLPPLAIGLVLLALSLIIN